MVDNKVIPMNVESINNDNNNANDDNEPPTHLVFFPPNDDFQSLKQKEKTALYNLLWVEWKEYVGPRNMEQHQSEEDSNQRDEGMVVNETEIESCNRKWVLRDWGLLRAGRARVGYSNGHREQGGKSIYSGE